MTGSVKCRARQYSDQMMCATCGLVWDMNDIDPPKCNTGTPPKREEIALIGFLAARLACYEPKCEAVKRAIEYLRKCG